MILAGVAEAASTAIPRVSRVIKEVKVLQRGAASVAAKTGVTLSNGNALRTAAGSRAEIILPDQSVARLGANTLLEVSRRGEQLRLHDGAVLFQAPTSGAATTITTGALSIATAGATGIVDRHGRSYVKVLVLQGTARVYLASKLGESVLVNEGQILITNPTTKALPEAVDFNIAQLYKTSLLTNRDFAPLASQHLIEQAIARQKKDPSLFPTNLVIYGRGTLVTLSDPGDDKTKAAEKAKASPTPSSSPAAKGR